MPRCAGEFSGRGLISRFMRTNLFVSRVESARSTADDLDRCLEGMRDGRAAVPGDTLSGLTIAPLIFYIFVGRERGCVTILQSVCRFYGGHEFPGRTYRRAARKLIRMPRIDRDSASLINAHRYNEVTASVFGCVPRWRATLLFDASRIGGGRGIFNRCCSIFERAELAYSVWIRAPTDAINSIGCVYPAIVERTYGFRENLSRSGRRAADRSSERGFPSILGR